MRKLLSVLLIISLFSVVSYALSDVSGHWAEKYIDYLINKRAINGYEDGTFRPEHTITTGEFSKILVASLGHQMGNATDGSHWASLYMAKAKAIGLILNGETEFEAYDANINRGMMARMISRAMTENYDDLDEYKTEIADYNTLESINQQAVLKVFRGGIVNGYPDGTFQDMNHATRAEASTILARLFNKEYRLMVEKPGLSVEDIDFSGIDFTGDYVELESGINLHEGDGVNSFDFYIAMHFDKDYERQLLETEAFLNRWLNQNTVRIVMAYIKNKRIREDILQKEFEYNGKKFVVGSSWDSPIIEIKGFY